MVDFVVAAIFYFYFAETILTNLLYSSKLFRTLLLFFILFKCKQRVLFYWAGLFFHFLKAIEAHTRQFFYVKVVQVVLPQKSFLEL
jgi:hypothetical protein